MKIQGMKTMEVFFGESWEDELFGEISSDDESPRDDDKETKLTLIINVNEDGIHTIPLNS